MSDFMDRARAAAERRYRQRAERPLVAGAVRNARMEAFERGALWAVEQGSTDDEVEAAARAMAGIHWRTALEDSRAALLAARDVRRGES